jgi:hypothetical protein
MDRHGFGVKRGPGYGVLIGWLSIIAVEGWAAPRELTTHADVRILHDLTGVTIRNLSFGRLAVTPGRHSATITVTPDDTVQTTGGVVVLHGPHRGQVSISGEPNETYTVQVVASVALGDDGLIADNFRFKSQTSGGTGGAGYVATLDSAGADTLYLGGTLQIPPRVTVAHEVSVPVPITLHYQ